jgi:hypothetical protein
MAAIHRSAGERCSHFFDMLCRNLCLGLLVLTLTIALVASWYYEGIDTALLQLMPLVPSHYYQNYGVKLGAPMINTVLPFARSLSLWSPALECFSPARTPNSPVLVLVSTNKGGAILSARIALEIAYLCGLSVQLGSRIDDSWPPPEDLLPTSKADILLAITNLPKWPEYAKTHSSTPPRCVVMTRHPMGRFRSLFTYAYDGGESGFRGISKTLSAKKSVWNESVDFLYEELGRETMIRLHKVLVDALNVGKCTQVTFEDLTSDKFDEAAETWLAAWGIRKQVWGEIVNRINRHNVNKLTEEQRRKDAHLTSFKWPAQVKKQITDAINAHPELSKLIATMKTELGYAENN